MTVVSVEPPRLHDAIRVAVLAGPADVVHQFVPAILLNGLAEASAEIVQHFIPRHALPLTSAPFTNALQRIEDAIGIFQLIGRDDALGARAAARPGMDGIAF